MHSVGASHEITSHEINSCEINFHESKHFRYVKMKTDISNLLLLHFVSVFQLDIMHEPKQHFLFLVALENLGIG